jgi:DUF4097 and DUF4098 domain-containing protein YvlB
MASPATNYGYRRRRGGYVGGFILILLGVLLLAHNFRPEIPAWEILARWWPVLLILLGVGRMIENIIARQTGQTPGRLITGGEVFVILLILCAAGVITFAHRHPGAGINWIDDTDPPWGEHAEETQELPPRPVKPGAEIVIQAMRGDITVTGTDDTEIRVVAKKSATAFDEDSARRRARAITVKLVETSRGYEVSPETNGSSDSGGGGRVRTDLEVQVPKHTVVNVKTENGNLHICDIAGGVDASTVRGTIEVCNSGADVRADIKHGDVRILTAKGNVRLTGSGSAVEIDDVTGDASVEGEFYGPIRARNVAKGIHFVSNRTDLTVGALPGRMEMDSGDLSMDDASGNIQLTTRDKNVVMENLTGRLRIESKRGEVTVRLRQAPKEDLSVSNESGGVELALPANSGFEVDAVSRSGEVSNDFGDSDLKTTDDGHGNSTLRGKHGSKGPRIELRTSYGQIRLRKSD